jgi:hypothetical protein
MEADVDRLGTAPLPSEARPVPAMDIRRPSKSGLRNSDWRRCRGGLCVISAMPSRGVWLDKHEAATLALRPRLTTSFRDLGPSSDLEDP